MDRTRARFRMVADSLRSSNAHFLALAEQGGMCALNFVSVATLGRYLASDEFALYVMLYATISLPYLVSSTFWTYPALVFLPKQPDPERAGYRRIVHLCNGTSIVLLCLPALVLASRFIRPYEIGTAGAAILAALGWANYDGIRRLAYAAQEGARLVVPSLLLIPFYLAGITALQQTRTLDAATALLCLGISYLASSALAVLPRQVRRDRQAEVSPAAGEVIARHWRLARWLIPGSSAYYVTSHGFFVIGARLLTDTELGGLRAAQNLVNVMTIVLLAFENYHVPRASTVLHEEGTEALYRYVGLMYARATVLFGAATLVAAPSAYVAFRILYGDRFSGYENLVFVFAAFQLMLTLSVPGQVAWNTQEKAYVCMTSTVVAAGVACVVAVPLIVWGRAYGAALGMLASVSTITVFLAVALGTRGRGLILAGATGRLRPRGA